MGLHALYDTQHGPCRLADFPCSACETPSECSDSVMQRAAHKHQKALEEAAERAEAEKADFRQKSSQAAAAAVAATEERLRTAHGLQCAICFLSLPMIRQIACPFVVHMAAWQQDFRKNLLLKVTLFGKVAYSFWLAIQTLFAWRLAPRRWLENV